MFDIAFSELCLVVLVALLLIGPKDLPVVLRTLARWLKEIKSIARDFRRALASLVDEDETITEIRRELRDHARYIEDEEGRLQRIYDISDLQAMDRQAKKEGSKPPNPIVEGGQE